MNNNSSTLSRLLRKIRNSFYPYKDITDDYIIALSLANNGAGMLPKENLYCLDHAIRNLPGDDPVLEIGSFAGLSTNAIIYYLDKNHRSNKPNITLLQKGVGSREDFQKLKVAANGINSTFSDEFIEKYKHYKYLSWNEEETVPVTTLDKLIAQFGVPHFCKIDVEGYELEVFKGLSQPIDFIQFEYVPPFRTQVIQCIDLLSKLGNPVFNYYGYENMRLELKEWVNTDAMKKMVNGFPEDFLVADILVKYSAV